MTDHNAALVREAYEAYGRGDVAGMLEFVDPGLEWTYLDRVVQPGAFISAGSGMPPRTTGGFPPSPWSLATGGLDEPHGPPVPVEP